MGAPATFASRAKKLVQRLLAAAAFLLASGCAPDDSWLFPLSVETDVVVKDVDGDGRADVVTIAQYSTSMSQREGRLVVHRQTSPGVFTPGESYVVGIYPWRLVVADVDGDGAPDLVVTDHDGQTVWMLLQDTASPGRFLPPQRISTTLTFSYDAVVADLDGDGVPDVAVADTTTGSNRIVLLRQDAAHRGTFLPPMDLVFPGVSESIAAGDVDGDGRTDLAAWTIVARTGYTPNGELVVGRQQPDGTLGPLTAFAPQTGLNVWRLAIADYDGDGKEDLFVFFSPFSADYRAKLSVLLQGAQAGTFAAPVDTSLAGIRGIDDATIADLDGDGHPDVAVVGFFPVGSPSTVESRLNLFTQSGGGSFALSHVYDLPIAVSRVAAGDIDGDGLNDLVVLGDECLVLIQSHEFPGTFNAPYALP